MIIQADPQSGKDTRGIPLEQVGISRVRYPVMITGWDKKTKTQKEVEGLFDLTVSLAAENRGIHMSRLIESLHHWEEPLGPESLQSFLKELRRKQNAAAATMNCNFTWFVNQPAPESKRPAWQGISTTWHATQSEDDGGNGYTLRIPVTTLCPCSKEISDYGAHSQRSWIVVKIKWQADAKFIFPEEIFQKLQHAGSSPIHPLLKRADERHVTMKAYEQPAFVEDTARHAALLLQGDSRISNFRIEVRNEESIHTHDAIAIFNSGKVSVGDFR
tara:strand:+ start:676 stop:1494 length:819 start_codon:yes stop_codon:yes gene_type:complete